MKTLFGIYTREAIAVMEKMIGEGRWSLNEMLEGMNVVYIPEV